jgi:phage baseplate assembly protein W
MTEVLGSGLAFPLSVDRRGAVALAHGETDVEQAIVLILATAPGERPMRPEFGCELHDLVFETVDAATVGRMEAAVRSALDRWEPRVDVTAVDVDLAAVASGRLDIRIEYAIRATNHRRNLVYPFYVIPAEETA